MRRKKRSWRAAATSLVGICCLLAMMYIISPSTQISIGSLQLSIVIPFFLLLATTIYSVTYFVTKSKIHGFLGSLVTCSYLLFRMYDLTHPFFIFLLIALFLTLELIFAKPRQ